MAKLRLKDIKSSYRMGTVSMKNHALGRDYYNKWKEINNGDRFEIEIKIVDLIRSLLFKNLIIKHIYMNYSSAMNDEMLLMILYKYYNSLGYDFIKKDENTIYDFSLTFNHNINLNAYDVHPKEMCFELKEVIENVTDNLTKSQLNAVNKMAIKLFKNYTSGSKDLLIPAINVKGKLILKKK